MKKIIVFLMLSLFITTGFAEDQIINLSAVKHPPHLLNILTRQNTRIADLESYSSDSYIGTGNIFYVDSGVGSDTYDGTKLEWAKATLDAAVALCTANNGDIIYVMQGHNESLIAADAVDLDVAGITVIGLGEGQDAPTFDYDHADGEFVIGAASVTIKNLRFRPSVNIVTKAIDVENAGDNAKIINCHFVNGEAAGTDEFVEGIIVGTTATDIIIAGCDYYSTGAPTNFICLDAATIANPTVIGNVIYGTFSEAGIWAGAAIPTNCYIAFNTVSNLSTGQYAIEFAGAATGICEYNRMYTDTIATTLDPGSMACIENYGINTTDLSAIRIPALPAIGTVTAGSADDILKKLYYTADGTGNYPATIAQESALAYLMSKSATAVATSYNNTTDSLEAIRDNIDTLNAADQVDLDAILADTSLWDTTAEAQTILFGSATPGGTATNQTAILAFLKNGTPDKLTTPASTFTILDILGTDGFTTTGAVAGSILGAIGTNEAASATPFTSIAVQSDPDGSVIERQEYMQKLQEILTAEQLRSIAGSAMPLAVWYVDAGIATSGDGKSPAAAFKTMAEAITACSNTVDDWVLVYDYSGGEAATITINKSFVHIIGNACKGMPYPRIMPTGDFDGITITDAGDRVEIANMVIGGGTQGHSAITFSGAAGSYGVYIHDCVIGCDATAPALYGIYVPSGSDAPYLYVENNTFYGADGAGIVDVGSAIRIAGNATRCNIIGNYIQDVGRTATPAIWLDGGVTNPRIENNRIKTDTDTGAGSAITLGASVDDGWIACNYASDGKDAPGNTPFADAGSTNGWSQNYSGIVAVLP